MQRRRKSGSDEILDDLKSEIIKMKDPQDKLTAQCMVVLLSAVGVGADVDRLIEQTGYPRYFIDCISLRMRKAGLWIGDLVDDREWWGADGNLTWRFFAQALVAQGAYVRERTQGDGSIYLSFTTGEVKGEWRPRDNAG